MKHKLFRLVILSTLLALIFGALGIAPARAFSSQAEATPWDTNLLTNPGAETGDMSGWNIILNQGDGWAVADTGHQGSHSFITSWSYQGRWDTRYQEIDLLAEGFTAAELDLAPQVTVGEWFKGDNAGNPADKYYIKVELRNASHTAIASWNAGSMAAPLITSASWAEQTHTFNGYGSGVRYIYLEDGGTDTENWAGHYGAMLDDAYVTIANLATISETFSSSPPPGWTLLGSTTVDTGWLRLTPASQNQVGNAVYNTPLYTTNTLDIEFDYAAYGGSGADGLTFYLIDGAAAASLGNAGSSVGYVGVTSGYVGVGFTNYQSTGRVKVWGSGSGATGFIQIANVTASTLSNRPGKHVHIVFFNNHLWVWLDGTLLIENLQLANQCDFDGYCQVDLPATVKFGFSGATGIDTNTHEVDNLVVKAYTPGIIRVTPDGASATPCGSTWENACALPYALTNALYGDELWVAAGTYKPTSGTDRTATFQLKNGVAVYGGFVGTETARDQRNPAANLTTLSGDIGTAGTATDNSYHVVKGATGATLDGFTITAGYANGASPNDVGGGIYNASISNATYSNLVIQNNYASNAGGGVDNHSSTPTFINVTVANNTTLAGAYGGGGMFNWHSNAIVTNATFAGNSSTFGGGVYNDWCNPTLTNVTFTGNSASSNGGGIYNNNASSPTLTNVTFTGNSASSGGGISNKGYTEATCPWGQIGSEICLGGWVWTDHPSSPTIKNAIFWNNTAPTGPQIHNDIGNPSVTYSVVQGGYTGTGNRSTDPKLGTLGYYGGATQTIPLLPGSSAINAGNSCTAGSDQRGVSYVGTCDIGAFEYNYDGTAYYAKETASGTSTCASWANACTLQTALKLAGSGNNIWAAAGTHKPTTGTDRAATFQLKNGVAVYGGFDGTETALDQRDITANVTILSGDLNGDDNSNIQYTEPTRAENSYHVVTGITGATLDGFTITGGNANDESDPARKCGGGMYNAANTSPTVTNVTFNGNSGKAGGGMCNEVGTNGPVITNVTFSNNAATDGGGMAAFAVNTIITNATFSSNRATSSGGGMLISAVSSPTLTNVTFSGNESTAGYGGGIYIFYGSSALIKNVIIANSIGSDCIGASGFNNTSSNNLIESGACGLSNGVNGNIIGSDPRLGALGNYGGSTQTLPLLPGSPALNTGSACAAQDQRGKDRVGACDIGAFESQGFTLSKTGGDNQSAAINAPFPLPLTVSVTANDALEPVNGGKVTFTPPSTGASAALTGSPATITDGSASVDATANATAGSHTVTASAAGAASVDFTLTNQAIPVLTWANPADITYGTALSATQLNATADVAGTFTYTPASGAILDAGPHTLHVDFTPTDTVNFTNASKDVSITVTQATTILTWANPADIVYGTALSGTPLNATANTPGSFTYTPASGTILAVGTHTLHVEFVPTDTVNFTNASKDVSLTVTQATPVITWANPANIVYGIALGGTQLNATANTPGAFTYIPALGTVLNVGTHTLHVDFTPTDTVNFTNASKDVSLTVTQATPVIVWSNPANIVYGTALSDTQLNAVPEVPGVLTYTPASGTILAVGTHTLHVEFVPTDTTNFTNASKDVSITVTQATTVLTWANPANIIYGTALSGTQLNATANTPGTFTYTPASGTVLAVGTHTLHVEFVPTDTANFTNASKDVSITVTQATTVLTWANPANIIYGTALSGTQLNATANTPGAFTYTPASGTVLAAGTHTLHVEFVPTDTANFTNASKDVSITVTQATPVITWANPADIDQGTALSDTQLNATADVPGTFTYTPASGTYLSTGTHTLHVDFVPTDALNYANASKEVSLTVLDHAIFADVPSGYWARLHIESLYLNQITGGCANNPLRYCPTTNVNRAMMAVFVLRAAHGLDFTPPDASGTVFTDVPADGFAAAWIEQLAADGITGGCGGGKYCPNAPVTRAMMAVFLVKAMYGVDYNPPEATGTVFLDVPQDGFAAAFIEKLAADGVTGGCGGGNFCPNKYINRAEMAVFLVAAFNLP